MGDKGLNEKLDAMKLQMVDSVLESSARHEEDPNNEELITVSKTELGTLSAQIIDLAMEKAKGVVEPEQADDKHTKLLETLVEAFQSSGGNAADANGRLIKPMTKAQIDPSDILEKPAIFFTYSFTWAVLGDKKYGQDVHTPYKTPIRFEHVYRYNKKGSTRFDNNTVCLSSAKIHSKKECDWLRSHSLFNIKFFEKIDDVRRYDVTFAEKMVEISNQLNGMSQFEVLERAKLENIPVDTDIDKVRRELTFKMAADGMNQAKQAKHPTVSFFGEDGKETQENFLAQSTY